jgi:hypothetical protein
MRGNAVEVCKRTPILNTSCNTFIDSRQQVALTPNKAA